jgi:uncharacterized membrane protein YhaH (DUF805 family)
MIVALVHLLFGFDGRLGRRRFALGLVLALLLAAIPLGLGILASGPDQFMSILAGIVLAVMILIWSLPALGTQRLHDLGLSGLHMVWVAGLALAAIWLDDPYPLASLGLQILLGLITLGLLFIPGEREANRFGAPP